MTDWKLTGMTQEQQDALAERIKAVLHERQIIGAERRIQERKDRLCSESRNQDETHLGLSKIDRIIGHPESLQQAISDIEWEKVPGVSREIRERIDRRMEEINAAYEALKRPGHNL